MRSSWQATVTSGSACVVSGCLPFLPPASLTMVSGRPSRHAMYSTKRVLPQPVGPLSSTGMLRVERRLEQLDLVADRQVVRLDVRVVLLDRVLPVLRLVGKLVLDRHLSILPRPADAAQPFPGVASRSHSASTRRRSSSERRAVVDHDLRMPLTFGVRKLRPDARVRLFGRQAVPAHDPLARGRRRHGRRARPGPRSGSSPPR